jgi:acetyl esterase/lipase
VDGRVALSLLVLVVLVLGAVFAIEGSRASVAAAALATDDGAAAVRYADAIFPTVDVQKDLVYGSGIGANGTAETLKLDLYEPAGDALAARPAIVYIHGGSFAGGDKSEGSTAATELARHGYVVVSINYRLNPGPLGDFQRLAKGQQFAGLDARAAVRWLRRYALERRIDPRVIGAIGYSAGAITALNLNYNAYASDADTSGNPGYPSNVEASVSLSGYAARLEPGAPPIVMFHGDADDTVPYAWAVRSCTDTKAMGNACELVTYPGLSHNIYARYADWMPKTVAFYLTNLVPLLGQPVAAKYHPLTPTRILDSRTAVGGWAGKLTAGAPRPLQVGGVAGVPVGATAVVMNVTATAGTDPSFLSVRPATAGPPATSNLNFAAGQTIANLVTVKLDATGAVSFANAVGATDVVADLVGFYDYGIGAGARFNGLTPTRFLDSRTTTGGWNGPLVAESAREVRVRQPTNAQGVPSTATAVVANITVTGGTKGSYVSVWPSGSSQPGSSTVNFAAGQTIPNLTIVPIGAWGGISFANATGAVDVVMDIVGFFDPTTGSVFHPIDPTRVLDDRVGTGLSGPWGPGQSRSLAVAGAPGTNVPAGATGLVANVTATGATSASYVTVHPEGSGPPTSSNLNFAPGETIANLVTVGVGGSGAIVLTNHLGSVDLVADTVGYYAPT